MIRLATINEFLEYGAWANARLLDAAANLPDDQLDAAFPIGMGTLRRTLLHVLAGESVWLKRWQAATEPAWPDESERASIPEIKTRFTDVRQGQQAFLSARADDDLGRGVVYRDSKGTRFETTLGDMLLQVCVHSQHHRAQLSNLLRRCDAEPVKPGLDYIFMRIERGRTTPASCDLATLQTWFRYGDWANQVLLDAAQELGDAPLDQTFEMGVGTLRKTLQHVRSAEHWWLTNWTRGPVEGFPAMPADQSIGELRLAWRETISARDAFLQTRRAADLATPVEGRPRTGVVRSIDLGGAMLQLCGHGVHHRAQAVNMLRSLTGRSTELDYMMHVRTPAE
ncbi:MAG: hypothetical protein FLDDKLPJ_00546 [Phycisphaerae bacterium]|nr:hypothetical protein [Phycisphaerae bacterium]